MLGTHSCEMSGSLTRLNCLLALVVQDFSHPFPSFCESLVFRESSFAFTKLVFDF
jgi:hypothetical protein